MKNLTAILPSAAVVCGVLSLIVRQQTVAAAKDGIAPSSGTTLHVGDPRCEYLINPLGIDTALPRFSWKLLDTEQTRGQKQTAWQIVVTGGDGNESPVLWGSGKVASEESVNNAYAGKVLRSNQAARWKARVWDKDGKPTAWSADARFSWVC